MLVLIAGGTPGCSSMFASLPGIGEPEGVPERPAVTPDYPAVHDMPPPREDKPLTEEERRKLAEELEALRARQATGTTAKGKSKPRN
jgi:hypothetical protein